MTLKSNDRLAHKLEVRSRQARDEGYQERAQALDQAVKWLRADGSEIRKRTDIGIVDRILESIGGANGAVKEYNRRRRN